MCLAQGMSCLECLHNDLQILDVLGCMLAGVLTLLPGQYIMSAAYGGDANSAAALVTAPYIVDGLCLVQALLLGP